MKSSVLLSVLILFSIACWGRSEEIIKRLNQQLDSIRIINNTYVDVLNDLAFEYIKMDPEKGIQTVNRALRMADSLGYDLGCFRATIHKGSSYWINGLYDEALKYYLKATSFKVNDPHGYQFLYNNIAETYKKKNQLDSASKFLKKSIGLASKSNQPIPPMLFSNLAEVFYLNEQYDSAELYFEISRESSTKTKRKRGTAYALFGLADIAYQKGNTTKSIELHEQSLKIREAIQDKRGIIQSLMRLAELSFENKDVASGLNYLDQAEEIAMNTGLTDLLYLIYFRKYELYQIQNHFRRANEFLVKYHSLKDSIESIEFVNRIGILKNALNAEEQLAENELLKEQKRQQEQELSNRSILILGISLIVFALGAFIYQYDKRLKITRKASTKLRETNKELNAANQRLLEMDQYKESMTAMIVHDFKNSLNTVISFSETKPSDQRLKGIRQAGQFMLNMVMNILDVQKYETTKPSLSLQVCEISKLIQLASMQLSYLIEQKSIELIIDQHHEFSINGDKDLLVRVLGNILSNAIKYSPQNGKILIKVAHVGNDVMVAVKDEGPGIPKSKLEFIFDKFAQVDARKEGLARSTGIGLTFCKIVVEAHKGAIWADSTHGEGSTFNLTLPITKENDTTINHSKIEVHPNDRIVLQIDEKENLAVFIGELRKWEVFDYSEVMEILENIPDDHANIRAWKKSLAKALHNGNEKLYKELIQT